MKKSLLLCLTLAAGIGSAMADVAKPKVFPSASFQQITPDGRYIVSELYGDVIIYDLVEGTQREFVRDEDYIYEYSIGGGNCITADGNILLVSTNGSNNDAAYIKGDQVFALDVPDSERTNLANGITPDGSRICGSIGLNDLTLEEVIMQVPVYWDRNADGDGYGECHALPYPTKDFFGETPQYVTAVTISNDGKTIVGQIRFSSGSMCVPVVYTEDDKGEWSYSLPTKHLFNPDGLEPVENPGDAPWPPQYDEYMTPEEKEAYVAAQDEFWSSMGEVPWPEPTDYMSEESLAAFNAAEEKYQAEHDVWEEKYDAYQEYSNAVLDASPNFIFNNCILSTDGKYLVSTLESLDPNQDPWSWFQQSIYTPCTLNLETGELHKVDTEISCLACGVADDGIIFAHNGVQSTPMTGYVIKNDEVQTIEAYLNGISPEYGEWIEKNMSHEVVVDYDPDTWEEIYAELTFAGMPVANPDMSVVSFWTTTPWDWDMMTEGVVFDLSKTGGVTAINVADKNISAGPDGSVIVPDGFAALEVFNLNGVCVKYVSEPNGVVSLNLAGGVYIAKGTRADGSVSVVKLAGN